MGTQFSSAYTLRDYRYSDWKAALAARGSVPQADASDGVHQKLWFYDGPEIHTCFMWLAGNPVTDPNYTQAQNDADLADYQTCLASAVNATIEPKLSDGRVRLSSEKTALTRANLYSHDWSDPTTWFTQSLYVEGETPATSDNKSYTLANKFVIDTYHGKLTTEDFLKDASGRSYRVAVMVNGTLKTEQDPHFGSGGDYTIDYSAGTINFLVANQPTDAVTVNYHYANGSRFVIAPKPGQKLVLDSVEVQFSTDVDIRDSVIFQPVGLVDVFAPQLIAEGVQSGTKIPLGDPLIYKSISDLQNDANKAYPTYPPMGGTGWRGCPVGMVVLDWDYTTRTELRYDYGMEIHVSLQHDEPFGGFYATATFYCVTEPI